MPKFRKDKEKYHFRPMVVQPTFRLKTLTKKINLETKETVAEFMKVEYQISRIIIQGQNQELNTNMIQEIFQ